MALKGLHKVCFIDDETTVGNSESLGFDESVPRKNKSCLTLASGSSSAIRSSVGSVSVSSIRTSILDDEDARILKEKLLLAERKCQLLENSALTMGLELTKEKQKSAKLEKKLQFVKDNQEVFMRLKEAYINMKYNEAAGRKMVEIRERSIQTWPGILCRTCIETLEYRKELEDLKNRYAHSFIITESEMKQLNHTVKYLKDFIAKREKAWSFNIERDYKQQKCISQLQAENESLRELVGNKSESKISERPSKEIGQLKKIIVKLEKRHREILEIYDLSGYKCMTTLNDKERKIVNALMKKYKLKITRKNQGKLTTPSSSLLDDIKETCQTSKKYMKGMSNMNFNDRAGKTIMVMDTIFNSDDTTNNSP